MTLSDLPTLVDRLHGLADALGHKRVTTEGCKVWAEVLREFAIAEVGDVICGWAKTSNRMPAPCDVANALNERRSRSRESDAATTRNQFDHETERTLRADSPIGRELRKLANSMQSRSQRDPKGWARAIYGCFVTGETWSNGNAISEIQIASACTALHKPLSAAYAQREANQAARLAA